MSIPISRYMTPTLLAVTSKDTANGARELMQQHTLAHLPVVDQDQLVGVVSERDLQRWRTHDDLVVDAMTTNIAKVDEATPLDQVLSLMTTDHLGSVIVTSKSLIAGIFTMTDAMRAFVEMLREATD
jgi:CBS domain-containing protein